MIRKVLKPLLWFISGSSLLIGLTLFGFYLYYAIPMQKNFAALETKTPSDCVTGDYWQIITPWNDFPPRVREIFERFNSKYVDSSLSRKLIEGLYWLGSQEAQAITPLSDTRTRHCNSATRCWKPCLMKTRPQKQSIRLPPAPLFQ